MKSIKLAKRIIKVALEKDNELNDLHMVFITDILNKNIGTIEGGWEKVSELILKRLLGGNND